MDTTNEAPLDVSHLRYIVKKNKELHKDETALYWADKIMTITDDIEDILVCANCLYDTGQYHRAVSIVKAKTDYKNNARCTLFIANSHFACKEYDQTIIVITEFLNPSDQENQKPLTRSKSSKQKLDDFLASSLHLLLGKAYETMGNYELAAEEFRLALTLDVYCHEAYDKIIGHHLLTANEEQSLINSLPFTKQCKTKDEARLVSTLYNSQVKKYSGHKSVVIPPEFSVLESNTDILVNKAERLYYDCHFRDAYKLTSRVLNEELYHLRCLPLHIALLVELNKPHDLFYLAHKLVDTYPYSVVSWFGVACYYHTIQSSDLARQYFSKATSIDPLFGPAWLAFGHSFAAESEHDQAMAAYFRASHIMKGCHLPFLYIGLEYGLTSTTKLAEKFFAQARLLAPDDPFVIHEIGVNEFQNGKYLDAEKHMKKALDMIESLDIQRMVHMWEPLLNNMAHTLRKLKKYEEAISYHERALLLSPSNASTFSAIGYNYMLMCNFNKAVEYFHKALSIRKIDAFTSQLLDTALDELVSDISKDVQALGDYQPLPVKAKLDLSLLAHDSTNEEPELSESIPNTPRDGPHEPVAAPTPSSVGEQSNISMEMDMSMDDL